MTSEEIVNIPVVLSKKLDGVIYGLMVRTITDNDDWSTDMQTYKKFGVAVFSNPSICCYTNTELKKAVR